MPRRRGLPAATPLIERNAKFKEVFVAAMKLGSRYSELFSTTPRMDVSMVPRLVDQVLGAHEEETLSRVAKTWKELALWADTHNLIVGKMLRPLWGTPRLRPASCQLCNFWSSACTSTLA